MSEIIYLLTNPTMPDLVKIGRTGDLDSRIRQLSQHSGVPVPFECFFACRVDDGLKAERALHSAFGDHRINSRREFFRLNPERAVAILELLSLETVSVAGEGSDDDEEIAALHREQSRRSNFRFSAVEIPVGAVLKSTKDENIIARVVDDKRVEFEGEITSLSASARDVLHRFGGTLVAAQGPLYWTYNGETLAERRIRMEDED